MSDPVEDTGPVDLMTIVQDALFALGDARIAPAMGGMQQHVLQDTKPPLNIIGAIDQVNEGSKGEQTERFTLEVQSIYRGGDRRVLLRQMHAVRLAFDGQPLESDDAILQPPAFLDASVSDVGPDGQTYVGISNFEIYAAGVNREQE